MNSQATLNDLFGNAQADGVLSPGAMAALSIDDIGAQIQAGLGISADDVQTSEVLLVTLVVDDSYSIKSAGNEQNVRNGVNAMMDALGESKQRASILVHVSYLNGTQFPFIPLSEAYEKDAAGKDVLKPEAARAKLGLCLNSHNYQATGSTPLYDQQLVVLGRVLAKTQEFANNGVQVRSVTYTISDGADSGSRKRDKDCQPVVKDMLRQECHIIGGMGIDDGQTDFKSVFTGMGMDEKWVLTPGNTKSEIRQAFLVVSQSAVRASQAAGSNFSQVAGGGFGTP